MECTDVWGKKNSFHSNRKNVYSFQHYSFFPLSLLLVVKYVKEEQLRCLYSQKRHENPSFKHIVHQGLVSRTRDWFGFKYYLKQFTGGKGHI